MFFFQYLIYGEFLLVSVSYHMKLNIFWFWTGMNIFHYFLTFHRQTNVADAICTQV